MRIPIANWIRARWTSGEFRCCAFTSSGQNTNCGRPKACREKRIRYGWRAAGYESGQKSNFDDHGAFQARFGIFARTSEKRKLVGKQKTEKGKLKEKR